MEDIDEENEITKQETTDYSGLLSIKRVSSTVKKPKHFLTLGWNKYTKYMYEKYNLLELPPTIPKSSIVFGNDQFQYQMINFIKNSVNYTSEIPSITEVLHRQQKKY